MKKRKTYSKVDSYETNRLKRKNETSDKIRVLKSV